MQGAVHIENFGCRAARADGEALAAQLNAITAETPLIVVNTCSVTEQADRDARAYIRRAHREQPNAKILVTGCYAQRAPDELAALPGVSAVIGNSHKGQLASIATEILKPAPFVPVTTLVDDTFAHSFIEGVQVIPGAQTRPNLKVQEGCSNRCTFCIIPTTRGHSRSLTPEKILQQVHGFVAADGKELVLSGINLGRWGRDLDGSPSFATLIRQILEETTLPRLRLSSIEPMDWSADLIALMREHGGEKLCRHAHLPLQSGSDAVLRRMHRRYRPWHYMEKINALSAANSNIAFGADVMVGFPGETDAEFAETAALIEQIPFAYLHLFPFSPRPGTRGWALHQQTPVRPQVATERMRQLRSLAEEKSLQFRQRFTGQSLPAITLHTPAPVAAENRTLVLTDNFLHVELPGTYPANQLLNASIPA